MSASCWVAAARLRPPALTTPSQAAFVAPIASRARKAANSSPMRRSISDIYPCGGAWTAPLLAATVGAGVGTGVACACVTVGTGVAAVAGVVVAVAGGVVAGAGVVVATVVPPAGAVVPGSLPPLFMTSIALSLGGFIRLTASPASMPGRAVR